MRSTKIAPRSSAAFCGIVLVVGGVFFSATPASAYSTTGCSWAPYGSTVTWENDAPSGDYWNSATSAGYSWASATDINGMSPTSGLLVGYTDNKGNSGYDGWTSWGWSGSATVYANTTLNPYYTDGYSYANKTTVWVHELGHALGLGHSGSNAIMYYCSTCTGFTTPQPDDVNGINSLY